MRIGIFGGSFNPIHNGHIALGKTMLSAVMLDEVWYMVSPQNPLKKQSPELAAENVRLRLAQKALEDEPQLKACDYEFRLSRPSYTWNTLQHLSHDYPNDEFVLIIGGDNWDCFDRWAHYEDILKHYEVAVYPRKTPSLSLPVGEGMPSGVQTKTKTVSHENEDELGIKHVKQMKPYKCFNSFTGFIQYKETKKEAKKVSFVDMPLLDVSSTQVRQMIRQGQDISHLVPEAVVREVEKYTFYR